jgi:hypothetical protein
MNLFWIKPFFKRFDVSINLLSKERSFTKKEYFAAQKNYAIGFGEVPLHILLRKKTTQLVLVKFHFTK